jgi:hypothetical protein
MERIDTDLPPDVQALVDKWREFIRQLIMSYSDETGQIPSTQEYYFVNKSIAHAWNEIARMEMYRPIMYKEINNES